MLADANPWRGRTLEWQTSSPPPRENFAREPIVSADFYSYGDAGPEPEAVPLPGIPRERRPEPVGSGGSD